VPNNSTMDILQFKLYQQELEKKKKDKSVYSNVYNHHSYSMDGGSRYGFQNLYTEPAETDHKDHETNNNQDQEQQSSIYDVNSSDYNQSSNTITMKDTDYSQSSRTVTVKDSDSGQPSLTEQGQTQPNQVPSDTNITTTSTTEPKGGSYKPPLYLTSTKVNNNNNNNNNNVKRNLSINTSKLGNNSKIRVNTSLKLSQPINSSNSEIFYTPIDNDNEEHYNNGNRITNNDNNIIISKDISFKTSLSNDDSSSETSLNSPSGILYSPNGSKAFKDMSSLSIILPKNIDNSMVL